MATSTTTVGGLAGNSNSNEQHPRSSLPTPNPTASFWHSEPNEFLLGHRTTAELPASADVVIVGSGITGASAAQWLVEQGRSGGGSGGGGGAGRGEGGSLSNQGHGKDSGAGAGADGSLGDATATATATSTWEASVAGRKVVMLEAREACWGATGRNGGHCQPLLFDRGPDVAAFEVRNYDTVQSYIKEHNISCEWRGAFSCRSFNTPDSTKAAFAEVEILKKNDPTLGAKIQTEADATKIKEKYHVVEPEDCGVTVTQGAASLWPYKYVAFILEKLVRSGQLNLQTKTPVNSLVALPNGGARLHTDRGSIEARTVILATNAYTSHLLPSFADLIVPVRGSMSALLPPESLKERLPGSYGFVAALGQSVNHDDYLVQRPYKDVPNLTGHLMFGGGSGKMDLERIGASDDSIIDKGSAAYLRSALLTLMDLGLGSEDLTELKATHEWTGIMGYSRDEHPWVGAVPDLPGVWLAAGYTGHGMPNGTLCAKAVVDMIRAEENGVAIAEEHERLVKEEFLPRSYLITEDRINKARALPTVQVQELEGHVGNHLVRALHQNQEK